MESEVRSPANTCFLGFAVAEAATRLTKVTSITIQQGISNLQTMAVAEKREAEPTTRRRNEVGLAVGQATIELLAESCRQ